MESIKFITNNSPTRGNPVLKLNEKIKFGRFLDYVPVEIIKGDNKELRDAFASYVYWCKRNKVPVDNRIIYQLKQRGYDENSLQSTAPF